MMKFRCKPSLGSPITCSSNISTLTSKMYYALSNIVSDGVSREDAEAAMRRCFDLMFAGTYKFEIDVDGWDDAGTNVIKEIALDALHQFEGYEDWDGNMSRVGYMLTFNLVPSADRSGEEIRDAIQRAIDSEGYGDAKVKMSYTQE